MSLRINTPTGILEVKNTTQWICGVSKRWPRGPPGCSARKHAPLCDSDRSEELYSQFPGGTVHPHCPSDWYRRILSPRFRLEPVYPALFPCDSSKTYWMESVKEKEITIVLKQNSWLLLKILPWNYELLNIIKNSLCLVILLV